MVADSSLDHVYLLVWTTEIESIFLLVCLEIRAVCFAQYFFSPARLLGVLERVCVGGYNDGRVLYTRTGQFSCFYFF